jgi:hypothetical protein
LNRIRISRNHVHPTNDVLQFHCDEVSGAERHHDAKLTGNGKLQRLSAEARRQDPVDARRIAAALEMSEEDGTGLSVGEAGQLGSDMRTDTAEPLRL